MRQNFVDTDGQPDVSTTKQCLNCNERIYDYFWAEHEKFCFAPKINGADLVPCDECNKLVAEQDLEKHIKDHLHRLQQKLASLAAKKTVPPSQPKQE